MKIIKAVVLCVLVVLLAGCESLPFTIESLFSQTPTATSTPGISSLTTPETTLTPPQTTEAPPSQLVLWLPPQFDPAADNPAAKILQARLQLFSQQNSGVEVVVRIKEATGKGGLLDALSAAKAAAPDALPDVIAFSRPDLETAALKGLIYPIDSLTKAVDDPDWYAYAREMALIQGSGFGMPFAGDVMVIVYRPGELQSIPANWQSFFNEIPGIAFPADDPQAMTTLMLYQSAGGLVQDNQRRPMLQSDVLTEVLKLYQLGLETYDFLPQVLQYQTDGQAWQAFSDGQVDAVMTWISRYIATLPKDAQVMPMLPVMQSSQTLATGWAWALATPKESHHPLAIRLAEFLSESAFLAEWDAALGYIPVRSSSLDLYPLTTLKPIIGQTALSAHLRPSNDTIASLGPILREATLQVLKDRVDPALAAKIAEESLKGPQ